MTPEKVHLPGIPEVADQIHHEEALEDRDKAPPNDRRSMQTQDSTQTLSLEILAETLQQAWQQGRITHYSARNIPSLSSEVMANGSIATKGARLSGIGHCCYSFPSPPTLALMNHLSFDGKTE